MIQLQHRQKKQYMNIVSILTIFSMFALQMGVPTRVLAEATTSVDAVFPVEVEEEVGEPPLEVEEDFVTILPASATTTQETMPSVPIPENEATTTDVVIETGDAVAVTDEVNVVNTTEIDTPAEDGSLEIGGCGGIEGECAGTSTTTQDITATSTQEAIVDTAVSVDANSGENTIENAGGDAVIETGDAIVLNQILNLVNTNVIDTNFFQTLYNMGGRVESDINLTNLFSQLRDDGATASTSNMWYQVDAEQQGEVHTTLDVDANSGGNAIDGAEGDTAITTGDVYAGTTLINVLNTNLIGSNIVLSVINVFGEWLGDLVLPGEADLQQNDREALTRALEIEASKSTLSIKTTQDATIINDVFIVADTGNNSVSDTRGEATIETGAANVRTNIDSRANTTVLGGNWILGHVSALNQWAGDVWGLPLGASVSGTPTGVTVEASGGNVENTEQEEDESVIATSTDPVTESHTDVSASQSAVITNDIAINATSGGNTIEGAEGGAAIQTGDVNVLTDIMNIANSTVMGGKVILAFVNVFGTWDGNMAFGRPDLKISKDTRFNPDPPSPDGYAFHHIYYINMGNGRAHDVVLEDTYDADRFHMEVVNGAEHDPSTGTVKFHIGDVGPGESGEVWYSLQFNHEQPLHFTTLHSSGALMSTEDDWVPEDNRQNSSNLVFMNPNFYAVNVNEQPELVITKTHDFGDQIAKVGDSVHYTLEVENTGNAALYEVKVFDMMVNEEDEVVTQKDFAIGHMLPEEIVRIEYDLPITEEVPTGTYTNYAITNGFTSGPVFTESDEVSSVIVIEGGTGFGAVVTAEPEIIEIGENGLALAVGVSDDVMIPTEESVGTEEEGILEVVGGEQPDEVVQEVVQIVEKVQEAAKELEERAEYVARTAEERATAIFEKVEEREGFVLGASEEMHYETSTKELVTSTVASLTGFAPIFPQDNGWGWAWILLGVLTVLYWYVHKRYGRREVLHA